MRAFDPNAQGLSMTNAGLLGLAAATVYKNSADCEAWARQNGFDESFDFFSNSTLITDTNGFIAQSATTMLIAFRGTDPTKAIDWFIDFDALQEHGDFRGAKVHKGFADALDAVWGANDKLPQRLAARGNRAVWITGHSLGGALVELAAAKAALLSGIPVAGVYTFGQPRVGDEAFARLMQDALGARVFRFINDHDIVPRVPLFGMGYRHYASEIFFDNAGRQENRNSAIETLLAAVRLAAFAVDLDLARELLALGEALLTDKQAVAKREEALLGNPRDVLRQGAGNITDHSMVTGYLPRLGVKLTT
jgi:triacylglycerol lipase